MFGYDPERDEQITRLRDLFCGTEYSFDETAKDRTMESLVVELPELIHQYPDGIPFPELYRCIANTTPATSQHIKEVAILLSGAKELEIRGPKNEHRRSRVTDKDILRLPRQKSFVFAPPGLLDPKHGEG